MILAEQVLKPKILIYNPMLLWNTGISNRKWSLQGIVFHIYGEKNDHMKWTCDKLCFSLNLLM